MEVRVNDYNPLLLMLWKANIDIQYVAESSLSLAHYVSGYITKAEKSHLQDIWQEVSDTKSVYSRLWSFGIRTLRSRECGLYEASDLLLGDHLTEKSETVKWVDGMLTIWHFGVEHLTVERLTVVRCLICTNCGVGDNR